MRLFIAYSVVLIGVPYFAGLLFGKLLTLPLSWVVGSFRRPTDQATQDQAFSQATAWALRGSVEMPLPDRILHICMDVFNGFGAVLAAVILFHLLALSPSPAVLFILAAWELFFTIAYGQSFRALFGSIAGIVIGWFLLV
jgi:hypothetical protein